MEGKLKKRIYGIAMSILMAASVIATSFTTGITQTSEAASNALTLDPITFSGGNAVTRVFSSNKALNNGQFDTENLSLWFAVLF